jgi:hypothetical protein
LYKISSQKIIPKIISRILQPYNSWFPNRAFFFFDDFGAILQNFFSKRKGLE